MMMYMACSTRTSENKPNGTSEQIDGCSTNGPQNKKKGSTAQIPVRLLYPRRGQMARNGRPPPLEYQVQSATTHKAPRRAHNLTFSRGATNVQPTYSPSTTAHKALEGFCSSIDCRCKIHVNRRQWVVPRFLSRAPAPAQGSSSQTVEPQSDDTRPAASAASASASVVVSQPVVCQSINLSVWQSVCRSLVCACSVPSTYMAKSPVPPP